MPVLVRDKRGQPVGGLKKENFQVFDKDKPQIISGFTVQQRASSESVKPTEVESVPEPAKSEPMQPAAGQPVRFIVFMFDDLHLAFSDLALAQKSATRLLAGSLVDTDMAAVISTSGKSNSGMTRDRAKLTDTIMKLREQRMYRPVGRQCPDVSYYQADLIQNRHDSMALEAAVEDALRCANLDPRMRDVAVRMAQSSAMQALNVGEQDTRVTLGFIREVVRKMAALPGQRLLVLVSPGFLAITPEALSEKSYILDTAAQSNVTISALDARGLYVTDADASEPGGSALEMRMKADYRHQSMTGDEDVMAELADGTGGTYFHHSNDLAAGFSKLTEAPEYLYLLEFTPQDVKQDGAYHPLKVKVDQDGVKIQARRGYFAPKATKKK